MKLVLAEFIYNNLKHLTTSTSLFYILYRFYLTIKFYIRDNILEGEALVIIKRVRESKKNKSNLKNNSRI